MGERRTYEDEEQLERSSIVRAPEDNNDGLEIKGVDFPTPPIP